MAAIRLYSTIGSNLGNSRCTDPVSALASPGIARFENRVGIDKKHREVIRERP